MRGFVEGTLSDGEEETIPPPPPGLVNLAPLPPSLFNSYRVREKNSLPRILPEESMEHFGKSHGCFFSFKDRDKYTRQDKYYSGIPLDRQNFIEKYESE